MNNDLREIAIRTDSGYAWENPFIYEDVTQAISTIKYIINCKLKDRRMKNENRKCGRLWLKRKHYC